MIFEIVKEALDRSIGSIAKSCRLSRKEAIKKASECLSNFSLQWFSGEAPTLSYNEPLSRWSYCFAHVPANADLLSQVLLSFCIRSDGLNRTVLKSEELSICAIGGGPGTEVLAFAKLLKTSGTFAQGKDVTINVLDRESGWAENLARLSASVRKTLKDTYKKSKNFPFFMSCNHFPVNIANKKAFSQYSDAVCADIVTCCYFLSEIYDLQTIQPLIDAIKEAASAKAFYILIIDRTDMKTLGTITEFIESIGASEIIRQRFEGSLQSDEQTSTLADYIETIGRTPRIRWRAIAVLARVEQPVKAVATNAHR